jgi:putative membrane protein
MKKNFRLIVMIMVLSITFLSVSLIRGESDTQSQYPDKTGYIKDETIYVNLLNDGTVSRINAVNRIETSGPGTYTDFGQYTNVINLTDTAAPQTAGDKVTWRLDAASDGFYYQGTMANAVFPYTFSIKYMLDGADISAEDITGKSGDVKVMLTVTSDPDCAQYFIDNYFCQIQTSLDLEKNFNIVSADATKIIIGKTMDLSFTVLPGKSADFVISFDTKALEFSGFTFTCLPFSESLQGGIDVNAINEGFESLSSGSGQLITGTDKLKTGLTQLSDAANGLASGAKDIQTGLDGFNGGFVSYSEGIKNLSLLADQTAKNLALVSDNSTGLYDGFIQLRSQIDALLDMQDPDHLSQDINALRSGLEVYEENLLTFSSSLSQISLGMTAFSEGLGKLDASGSSLLPALGSIISGMASFSSGLSETAAELGKIPDSMKDLVSAETQLKTGIDSAGDAIASFVFSGNGSGQISFVSAKNKNVRSVQFIFKTDGIAMPLPGRDDTAAPVPEKGFFEKLFDLFR